MIKPSVWALALSPALAISAQAKDARYTLAIPPGNLAEALNQLAVQTGASIGTAGALPAARVRGVSGTMTVQQALGQLLQGTGLLARPTGPQAWRLERKAPGPRPQPTLAPPVTTSPDIIVSATKRDMVQATAPLSITIIGAPALGGFGAVPGTGALSLLADGLVLTNLGPGRNRSFIRGIADSPFNGTTQATVALEMNEARLTFNAPDPDLRLVDMERIEILEGPQGPLHGTGALGGVYRLVPQPARADRLEADLAISGEAVGHGSVGGTGSAMINVPLVADRLALRMVAYGGREPGWIDNAARADQDSNTTFLQGGRLALRWQPSAAWTLNLTGLAQTLHAKDSQYATSPTQPYVRDGLLAEPHHNDFYNGQLSVERRVGNLHLLSVTSWSAQEVDSTLDATAEAAAFGQTGLLGFNDDRKYRLINQEIRASGGSPALRWLAGLSYIHATTRLDADLLPQSKPAIAVDRMHLTNSEWAAFGEVSMALNPTLQLDLGARLFRAKAKDEVQNAVGNRLYLRQSTSFTPSAALGWRPGKQLYTYIRYASAYRPSGLSPFSPAGQDDFRSDELSAIEIGTRWHSADQKLHVTATGYFNSWSHIQSDYILANGLIATRNSGLGHIFGLETSFDWKPMTGWKLSGGVDFQHARLERAEPGLALGHDHALPIVPPYKAHFAIQRGFGVGSCDAEVTLRYMLIGPSRLSLDPGLDRQTAARDEANLSVALVKDAWRFALDIDNLTDSHADSFAFGNAFSHPGQNQRTPMRPRNLRLSVSHRWR